MLLDFDGPVCSIFAGLPATEVAARMVTDLRTAGEVTPDEWSGERDPLALLRRIADARADLVPRADGLLERAENEAAKTALPTAGASEMLRACADGGRSVWVVSNNAGSAIRAYLHDHNLTPFVAGVFGRVPGDPSSLKPNPRLLNDAIAMAVAKPSECVFIGDAARDVEAGTAAGIATIGYANKPGKAESLANAGAVSVVESMSSIVDALL
ncbi:HAD family hydrolase [Embleya sp. NPDC059259]|uniref:HAD family hydrolase n=1 Tax=unclassified Embleya TaxID=2699296 RepID=UPI00368AB09A